MKKIYFYFSKILRAIFQQLSKFGMILRIGFIQIFSHKLRSFLTLLGIILGVASLISMFSIVQGSNQATMQWVQEIGGINKVRMYYLPLNRRPPGSKESRFLGLTYEDAQILDREAESIYNVTPTSEQWMPVTQGNYTQVSRVVGTNYNFLDMDAYQMGKGIFFTEDDYTFYRQVAVVGTKIEEEYFQGDALGKDLQIGDSRYTVIGVLEEEVMMRRSGGQSQRWSDWKNRIILIPITTMHKRIQGQDILNGIEFKVKNTDKMNETLEEVKQIMLVQRDYIDDFEFDSRTERLEEMNQMKKLWNIVLGAIASISLLVGGIGIMNTLLSNITERIREIGIRKAIGAKKRDILFQFMIESIVLSCLGGLIGIAVGLLFSYLIKSLGAMPVAVSTFIILVSFSFSAVVGIVFGIMPSFKAARLDPIECLRYE